MDIMKYVINENNLSRDEVLKQIAGALAERMLNGQKLNTLTPEDWLSMFNSFGLSIDVEQARADAVNKVVDATLLDQVAVDQVARIGTDLIKLTVDYRRGAITESEYRQAVVELCLENALIAVDRYAEQYNINLFELIDDIGELIELADIEVTEYYVMAKMLDVEAAILDSYLREISELRAKYESENNEYQHKLREEVQHYFTLMDKAFDADARTSFEGSEELASEAGVKDVLKSKSEVDEFFM